MRNFFKKVTAFVLAGAMAVSGVVLVSADEQDLTGLLPLRMVFEANGAEVLWNDEGRFVTVIHNGVEHIFDDVIIGPDDRARIAFDDAAFLFGTDMFADAKRVAIETAYTMLEAFDIAGITIALVNRDTGYTWTQGAGFADVAARRHVNELTLFDTGSVVKHFTAVAVMQLVERGIIDLDEPIVTYIPEFSALPHPVFGGDYRNITTRMLLAHFSGLTVDFFGGMMTTGGHYRGFMNNFLPRLAASHMDDAELQRWSYANNGFTLLGILIARMSGTEPGQDYFQGFLDYMNEHVLAPAGMANSTFEAAGNPLKALPYNTASTGVEELVLINAPSAGGLFTNANDMAAYMHLILNNGGGLLSAESISEMFRVQDFDFSLSPNVRTGLGTMKLTTPGGFSAIGHGGNVIHYHSQMFVDFESGIGVFVSVNSASGAAASQIVSFDTLATAIYEKTGVLDVLEPLQTDVSAERSNEELERYTGFYTNIGIVELGGDGTLVIPAIPGLPFPLVLAPLEDGSFLAADLGVRFWFEELNGRMVLFQGDHRQAVAAERIYDLWRPGESFAEWVGVYGYYSDTPNSFEAVESVALEINDRGYAAATFNILGQVLSLPIAKIDGNTFFVLGTGRNLGRVIQVYEENGQSWLSFSGTRFVKS